MSVILLLLGGMACGIAAAMPLLLQARREEPDMAKGIAGVIGAFVVMQVALFAVHAWAPQALAPFGVVSVLTFLTCVIVVIRDT